MLALVLVATPSRVFEGSVVEGVLERAEHITKREALVTDRLEGEIELGADSIDHKWATIEEIGDYQLIDGILDEIKMVDEKLL
jgi:hypothetical protein